MSLDRLSRSRRVSPASSLPATSGEDRPSAVRPRSARDPCPLLLYTRGWRRSAVSNTALPPDLSERAVAEFAQVSSTERLAEVAGALEHNGIRAIVVPSGDEARQAVTSLLPVGAEVFNNTSRTLETIGVADDI